MKQDMDDGVLNCVITKDLSRLGRDHIMTDYLTEIYFPAMGIRYIAVDDNVDTQLRPDNEMIPIKNLFNDWHLRDTSKKVKNAKRQRMKMGYLNRSARHRQLYYRMYQEQNTGALALLWQCICVAIFLSVLLCNAAYAFSSVGLVRLFGNSALGSFVRTLCHRGTL